MASSSKKPYSATSFKNSFNLKPFYTGGPTAITRDGQFLLTSINQDLLVTHVKTGLLLDRIRGDTEDLTAICLTPDSQTLVLSSRSLSLRIYSLSFTSPLANSPHDSDPTFSHRLIRTIPSLHSSALTLIVSDPSSNFIATGSTDGTTKVWDWKKGYCTHFFKSTTAGVISSICWDTSLVINDQEESQGEKGKGKGKGRQSWNHLDKVDDHDDHVGGERRERKLQLIVGSVDGSIRVWDLFKSTTTASKDKSSKQRENKPVQTLLNAHVSPVRGLGISKDGRDLLSASRDKTIVRWKLKRNQNQEWRFHLMETITVGESIESLGFIQNPNQNQRDQVSFFWSGGEKGEIKIWELPISSSDPDSEEKGLKLGFIQPDSFLSSKSESDTPQGKPSEESEEDTRAITEVHQVDLASSEDETDGKDGALKVGLVSVHSDQTIIFRHGPIFNQISGKKSKTSRRSEMSTRSHHQPLEMIRQLIGFNDEIVDLTLLAPHGYSLDPLTEKDKDSNQVQPMASETHLAIATNSHYPRVYSLGKNDNHVELLRGGRKPRDRHSDMILCLDSSANSKWLVSGSKDRTARIWVSRSRKSSNNRSSSLEKDRDQDQEENDQSKERIEWICSAIAEGHSESIGAVSMAKRPLNNSSDSSNDNSPFMITGSSDKTIKLWDLTSLSSSSSSSSLSSTTTQDEVPTPTKLKSLLTLKIHDKDINSLDISPNNALLVSGSQDKTAKVLTLSFSKKNSSSPSVASLKQLAVCTGHKRGVWSVKFSPIDAAFATSSGDKTIRLWSLKDFSCVKIFDSHSHSVLRIDFLNRGTQLLSAGAEGVVRLWNVRDEENVWNTEAANDRIWGLKVKRGGKEFILAGADGTISWWKDDTKEKIEVEGKKREVMVQQEQDFNTFLSIQDYKNAISLALNMNQPRRLFFLFNSVSNSRPDINEIRSIRGEGSDSDSKSNLKKGKGANLDVEEPLGPSQLLNEVLNLNLPTTSKSRKMKELTKEEKSRLEDYRSITGSKSVDLIIKNLPRNQLNQLLVYIRDWNTSYKTCNLAQELLHAILRYKTADEIREAFKREEETSLLSIHDDSANADGGMDLDEDENQNAKRRESQISKMNRKDWVPKVRDLEELFNGIIPYTIRHLGRSDRNLMESSVLDYTLKCMDQILGEDQDGEEDDDDDEDESESEGGSGSDGENQAGKRPSNMGMDGISKAQFESESEEDQSEAESEDVEMTG